MIDQSRCPPNIGVHEYTLSIIDREREIPAIHQPEFPVDHSRREWLEFENEQLARADNQPHLRLPVLCYVSEMKRADQFWRQVLVSKIDTLFFTERELDYDQDDDHRQRCRQLADAKRAAGYPVHSAGREGTD
jgi:hypothetical protein